MDSTTVATLPTDVRQIICNMVGTASVNWQSWASWLLRQAFDHWQDEAVFATVDVIADWFAELSDRSSSSSDESE